MISFAQNNEDVVLMRVFADVAHGFYVDIGAGDPVFASVTKAFYDAGWSGLNVEPHPERAARLDLMRLRDKNVRVAASETACTMSLMVTKYWPLSTVEPSIIDATNPDYAVVDRIETAAMPLASLLDEHVGERTIHFLKIDVEGHEAAVLRGADWQRHRPLVLVIEGTCPTTNAPRWPAWEPLLVTAGYTFALFDGLNRFYVCNERTDLLPALSYGACCLDGYTSAREAELQARLRAAEEGAHVTSADAASGSREAAK